MHFDDENDKPASGRAVSVVDVMEAILGPCEGYGEVYDECTNIVEGELAALSQRVGFDEAQARAAERSVHEFSAALDGLASDVAQARAAERSIRELEHIDQLRHETAYMWAPIDQVEADVDALRRDIAQGAHRPPRF